MFPPAETGAEIMSKKVFPDRQSLIEGTAKYIADLAVRSIADRGRFTIALSGGNTPKPVYQRLAENPYRQQIDWSRVEVFFGDERCVPPDDPQSNYLHGTQHAAGPRADSVRKYLSHAGRGSSGQGSGGLHGGAGKRIRREGWANSDAEPSI